MLTLPLLDAGDRVRGDLPRHRRLPHLRPRLRPDERRARAGRPRRSPSRRFQNGFEFQRYGYASAVSYVMVIAAAIGITLLLRVVQRAPAGDGTMNGRVFGRVVSYVVLVLIGARRHRAVPLPAAPLVQERGSTSSTVPPTLHFDWATIKENYSEVIHDHHYLTFVENSIIVTGISTLIALVLGVPAAYAFSRLRFRGSDTWASTILSFRFMPPVAVAIPIYLMIRYLGLRGQLPRADPALRRVLAAARGLDHDRLLRRDPARDRRGGDGRRPDPPRRAAARAAAARAARACSSPRRSA